MVPGVLGGISPEVGIFGINPEGDGMVTDGVVGVFGFEAIPPSPIDKCSAVKKELFKISYFGYDLYSRM